MSVSITSPPDARIGRYRLTMEASTDHQGSSIPLGEFLLLFNPWCPGKAASGLPGGGGEKRRGGGAFPSHGGNGVAATAGILHALLAAAPRRGGLGAGEAWGLGCLPLQKGLSPSNAQLLGLGDGVTGGEGTWQRGKVLCTLWRRPLLVQLPPPARLRVCQAALELCREAPGEGSLLGAPRLLEPQLGRPAGSRVWVRH